MGNSFVYHTVRIIEHIDKIASMKLDHWQAQCILTVLNGHIKRIKEYKPEPFPEFISIIEETNRRLNK